ncbi:MAG: hypoxanthine phosphoribosyltransferase [Bacteroidia bacterium]|nr:hypoxanthine phosphoribosyltransferase [Bacteroidia bacterium]
MKKIKVLDKEFVLSVSSEKIQEAVRHTATRMNKELKGKNPIFIVILNGAFIFASDLMKKLNIDCQISLLKIASYHGTSSTGTIKDLIGLDEDIKGRTVVIVEDIVDTGLTLEHIIGLLKKHSPKAIKVCTLLFKPKAYKKKIKIDYVGIEIPNDFIIGYGLDYNGYARNTEDIYVLTK